MSASVEDRLQSAVAEIEALKISVEERDELILNLKNEIQLLSSKLATQSENSISSHDESTDAMLVKKKKTEVATGAMEAEESGIEEAGRRVAWTEDESGKFPENVTTADDGVWPMVTRSLSATADQIKQKEKLSNGEIARYSRQLILPELGVKGQLSICRCSVLVVGCGGLGCPAAVYLAAAGIGRLGLVDYDTVEMSNLHRQVMHSESWVGQCKSESLAAACRGVNSSIYLESHHMLLNSGNALQLIEKYDIVVDATDNVATRYLLNDACVLLNKPLVSGSALRFEGQVTVYNHKGSPCYRCLYPKPPSPDTVTNCSDGGVLGPVVGVIASLQAMEVLKIASNMESDTLAGRMLIYDGADCLVRCVRLRGRQNGCSVCGENPTITRLIDYEQFCGASASDKDSALEILKPNQRISALDYDRDVVRSGRSHLLIDVRQPIELEICRLPNTSHNIPIERFSRAEELERVRELIAESSTESVYVVCRRGNDSQLAVTMLRRYLEEKNVQNILIQDIIGGLHSWARHVDNEFPIY